MSFKLAIPTGSLGNVKRDHSFIQKLDAAKRHGIDGIELAYEDIVGLLEALFGRSAGGDEPNEEFLLRAARLARNLARNYNLKIICLQPFLNCEGLLDPLERTKNIFKLDLWIKLAMNAGTDLILIPSNFLPAGDISVNWEQMVIDLQEMAYLGSASTPPMRFAYKALSWGTHVNTWEMSWEMVKEVDQPNFGMVLDAFNIAGRVYADPTAPNGMMPNAEDDLNMSLERMIRHLDVGKVFYIQIADGEKLEEPLVEGHEYYNAEQPARMSYSRNCRLFYGEGEEEEELGGYLPIQKIADVIINGLGYKGWVSFEHCNAELDETRSDLPTDLAHRAGKAWHRLTMDMNLDVGSAIISEGEDEEEEEGLGFFF